MDFGYYYYKRAGGGTAIHAAIVESCYIDNGDCFGYNNSRQTTKEGKKKGIVKKVDNKAKRCESSCRISGWGHAANQPPPAQIPAQFVCLFPLVLLEGASSRISDRMLVLVEVTRMVISYN